MIKVKNKRSKIVVGFALLVIFLGVLFTGNAEANSTSSKQLRDGKVYITTSGTTKTCVYKDKYNKKVVKVVVVNRFKSC